MKATPKAAADAAEAPRSCPGALLVEQSWDEDSHRVRAGEDLREGGIMQG